ncbi:hypothetical protein ACES2J_05675 [Bdellovibrio bacteriovorus]|uniref:hypothetical protein n=1 Tax=Bdellovibrio bacteriovorus TaxID=959 RepID=UPI0035A596F8
MKHLLLFAIAIMLTAPAQAVTSDRFIFDFLEQTQRSLNVINKERAAEGKRLYCEALNQEQVLLIAATASVPDITVAEFTKTVTENLKCYPVFFPPWGRKGVGGTLLNTKAYVMDVLLVQNVLKWMNEGKMPSPETPLMESYNPDFFKQFEQ